MDCETRTTHRITPNLKLLTIKSTVKSSTNSIDIGTSIIWAWRTVHRKIECTCRSKMKTLCQYVDSFDELLAWKLDRSKLIIWIGFWYRKEWLNIPVYTRIDLSATIILKPTSRSLKSRDLCSISIVAYGELNPCLGWDLHFFILWVCQLSELALSLGP